MRGWHAFCHYASRGAERVDEQREVVAQAAEGIEDDQPVVISLTPDGLGTIAGMAVGDRILMINGQSVTSYDDGMRMLREAEGELTLRVRGMPRTLAEGAVNVSDEVQV